MGLYDEIKAIDEELEEGAEETTDEAEEEIDLGAESEGAETEGEEAADEPAAEEQPEKPKKAAKEPPAASPPAQAAPPATNEEFARLRREKDASDRRARMAEQALQQRQQPAQAPPAVVTKAAPAADPEPDKATNYEGWLEWNLRQTQRANEELRGTVDGLNKWKETTEQRTQRETFEQEEKRAFLELESGFAPTVPDYKEVTEWGWSQLAQSIKMLNPRMSQQQIHQETNKRVLAMAQEAAGRGEHPIESLYWHAKNSGYQPKAAPAGEQPAVVTKTEKLKPDLKQIAASQKKSGSPLSGGGKSGKPPLSREHVASSEFGFKDFVKLTPSELRELEGMT
jgi:hypothetical protein